MNRPHQLALQLADIAPDDEGGELAPYVAVLVVLAVVALLVVLIRRRRRSS